MVSKSTKCHGYSHCSMVFSISSLSIATYPPPTSACRLRSKVFVLVCLLDLVPKALRPSHTLLLFFRDKVVAIGVVDTQIDRIEIFYKVPLLFNEDFDLFGGNRMKTLTCLEVTVHKSTTGH